MGLTRFRQGKVRQGQRGERAWDPRIAFFSQLYMKAWAQTRTKKHHR